MGRSSACGLPPNSSPGSTLPAMAANALPWSETHWKHTCRLHTNPRNVIVQLIVNTQKLILGPWRNRCGGMARNSHTRLESQPRSPLAGFWRLARVVWFRNSG